MKNGLHGRCRGTVRGAAQGGKMYALVYWTGLATLVIWAACSAYFTVHGI
jgi:hypothetical protein